MVHSLANKTEVGLDGLYRSTRDAMLCFHKTNKGFERFCSIADDILEYIESTDIKDMDLSTSGLEYVHGVNVAVLCGEIGFFLELSKDEIYDLVLGGLLHDIGKHYIDPAILNKPSKLSMFERIAVSSHEDIGANIVKLFTNNQNVIRVVNHHHRVIKSLVSPVKLVDIDDKTYLLPLICAIADITDAILAKRVYKPSLDIRVARDDIYNKGILDIDDIYEHLSA